MWEITGDGFVVAGTPFDLAAASCPGLQHALA